MKVKLEPRGDWQPETPTASSPAVRHQAGQLGETVKAERLKLKVPEPPVKRARPEDAASAGQLAAPPAPKMAKT